jgi:hypothetical protein
MSEADEKMKLIAEAVKHASDIHCRMTGDAAGSPPSLQALLEALLDLGMLNGPSKINVILREVNLKNEYPDRRPSWFVERIAKLAGVERTTDEAVLLAIETNVARLRGDAQVNAITRSKDAALIASAEELRSNLRSALDVDDGYSDSDIVSAVEDTVRARRDVTIALREKAAQGDRDADLLASSRAQCGYAQAEKRRLEHKLAAASANAIQPGEIYEAVVNAVKRSLGECHYDDRRQEALIVTVHGEVTPGCVNKVATDAAAHVVTALSRGDE